jgi:hypothetical protein
VVPAAHELTRKTSIEPSKAQKGKQSNNSKNNYLIRLRALKWGEICFAATWACR